MNNLAHPGKRFQGQIIDGVIAYFLGFATLYVLDRLVGRDASVYAGIVVASLYFLLSDGLPNGQSLGKRLLGIRVVDKVTHDSCTFVQSFLRNVTFPLGIFDWIFIFFGSHRRLGDFFASTVVVEN